MDRVLMSKIKDTIGYKRIKLLLSYSKFELELAKSLKLDKWIEKAEQNIKYNKKFLEEYIKSFEDEER